MPKLPSSEFEIDIGRAYENMYEMYNEYQKELGKVGPMGFIDPQRLIEIVGSCLVPEGVVAAVNPDGSLAGMIKNVGTIVAPKNALQEAILERQEKIKKEGKW